jgi:hypothetical protein
MSADLRDQLRSYGEHWDETLALWPVDEIIAREAPVRAPVAYRGFRPLAVAALSAMVVLAVIGGVLLLLRPSVEQDPVAPLPTTAPVTQPPATPPPVTQLPITQPPVTPAPVTQPPITAVPPPETTMAAPPTTVPAANPVTYFTSDGGLPEGYPRAVTIAKDGSVWVAVADPVEPAGPCHVARFDGTDWTAFEAETGCIMSLFPAPGGGVIATVLIPNGELRLMEFDGAEWVDHHAAHRLPPVEEPVGATLEDGTLVLASHHFGPPDQLGLSLLTYDGTTWQVSRHLGLMGWRAAWASIAIDPNGDAWFVDRHDGGVLQLSHDGSTYHDLPEPSMMWIATTPAGDLWVTDGAALYRYDGSDWVGYTPGEGLTPPSTRTAPSSSGEYTLGYGLGFGTAGGGGEFWISEPDGVSVYRDGTWQSAERGSVPGLDFGFHGAVVHGPDGSTWVVTSRDDVHRFFDGEWVKLAVSIPAAYGPTRIAIDPDGTAWFIADEAVGRIVP